MWYYVVRVASHITQHVAYKRDLAKKYFEQQYEQNMITQKQRTKSRNRKSFGSFFWSLKR